jgi:hypothetical protein
MQGAILTPDILALFIPILAIVMGIGNGMLSIYLNYRKRREFFALYHQERMAAIEKGIELPSLPQDFFQGEGKPSRPPSHRTLLSGLILVFLGLTLLIALHFTKVMTEQGGDLSLWALLPVGVGAACLVYYFSVGRKLALAMEAERKAKLAEAAQARAQAA